MTNSVTFEAYLRYTRRQSSPEEARAVRAWLSDPANALLAEQWMQWRTELLEQGEGEATEMPDFEVMQDRLLQQLGLEPAEPELPQLNWWPRWAAAAAVLIGVLLGGTWLWNANHTAPRLTKITTAYGEVRTVQLPDGSTVKLNGHSTLHYANNLKQQGIREVWLEGEAFFAVRHLPTHRRFVVHTTAGFNVEVLGTQFTVYRRRQQARVVLLSGKVRVDFADSMRQAEVILKPGELLETQDKEPQRMVHKAVRVAPYAAWKDNKLVFDETSVAEVATRLSDTYGVHVVVADSTLSQRRLSGSFPAGELNAALQALEKSFHLTARREQNRITLSTQRLSSSHPNSR
ncbi:FecR domain-containing protein (plasmid) [Hymenobacter tibetensis]|uniref:FecR domain-containing protein n=1 Tax=Hymenobacter tibetensis TaxID=497967 RepID=A0ABY4D5J5_9BACT|nr:FecR domain-containing protein [Hymenobacter tibetensis]UOG77322.1 FecR domain-containing protein [Hymenobacter tibetensis]